MSKLFGALLCLCSFVILFGFVFYGVADERHEDRESAARHEDGEVSRMQKLVELLNQKLRSLGEGEESEEVRRLILREREEIQVRIESLQDELHERERNDQPRKRQQGRAKEMERLHEELIKIEQAMRRNAKEGRRDEVEKLQRHAEEIREVLERLHRDHAEHEHDGHDHGHGHDDDEHGHEHDDHHGHHHGHEHDDDDHGHDDHRDPRKRLHHMHVAIENLKAAGLHEEAKHVAHRAEEFAREIRRQHEHDEHGDGHDHEHDRVDHLEAEVHKLRAELKEVSQTLRKVIEWVEKNEDR